MENLWPLKDATSDYSLIRKAPRRGREAIAASFIKEIQEVQRGQEAPHNGGTIIPKDP